jgi:hypothetical protein
MPKSLYRIIAIAGMGLLAAVTAVTAVAAPASRPADDARGWQLGAGVGVMDYDEASIHSEELDYFYLQAGWRFNPYLSAAALVGIDLPGDCNCAFFSAPLGLRVRHLYRASLRAALPLGRSWELYGLLGYASLGLQAPDYVAAAHSDAQSISYGLGVSWKVATRAAFDLEWLPQLAKASDWRSDALTIGFRFQF